MYIITSTIVQGTMVTSFFTDMLKYIPKMSMQMKTNREKNTPENI